MTCLPTPASKNDLAQIPNQFDLNHLIIIIVEECHTNQIFDYYKTIVRIKYDIKKTTIVDGTLSTDRNQLTENQLTESQLTENQLTEVF